MRTKIYILTVVAVMAVGMAYFAVDAMANRGNGALGVVYVTSQGLYFDTFVSAQSLPPVGPFQLLADGVTEFGPGDVGYRGGRWWIDTNPNGYMDPEDTFLLCPLLPPGRETP
jgi:hypothetical protein